MRRLFVGYRTWRENSRLLDSMTLADLLHAYFSYPTIQLNAVLAAAALAMTAWLFDSALRLMLGAVIAVVVFSIVEYVFHRFVLHGRWLYRHKSTAALWKRVHYDHHQDTSDLSVMFGDPKTTLPPIIVSSPSPPLARAASTMMSLPRPPATSPPP